MSAACSVSMGFDPKVFTQFKVLLKHKGRNRASHRVGHNTLTQASTHTKKHTSIHTFNPRYTGVSEKPQSVKIYETRYMKILDFSTYFFPLLTNIPTDLVFLVFLQYP